MRDYIKNLLQNIPPDWLELTTHRLDIYDEERAKKQFLEQFELLFNANNTETAALRKLPTAYDYIRLGHPLSCVLEWAFAKHNNLDSDSVISFSSATMPVLAILRQNGLNDKRTRIVYTSELSKKFNAKLIQNIYGYRFDVQRVKDLSAMPTFEGSTVLISNDDEIADFSLNPEIDFCVNVYPELGSVMAINGKQNESYISDIQHVRRRETVAMTPADCLIALQLMVGREVSRNQQGARTTNKNLVLAEIAAITGAPTGALVGSSGLSVQYAIMMGLIHDAKENHKGKAIKFIVPPNCYGGTNDQARRVAASIGNVAVVDLPVDGDNDMVQSINAVLDSVAGEDAVPYIIAEIPTNPRVEVPNLEQLKAALGTVRKTASGELAIAPVFILDQTFCPNVHFLGEREILSATGAISYASGSKFPSGGKCTAGYVVGNKKAKALMEKIGMHLDLCDNEATDLQYSILAKQLPSMNQRIREAYTNTREFVDFIIENLPEAKINFVSDALAAQGFTPSVFSLGLPTKGTTSEEKETYKRELNHKLIQMMITQIPEESKYCVSYGQLKGCYWTIPATSTQGTTKEGDKDYIVRAALSPDMNLDRHKKVFLEFVEGI